MSNQLVAGVCSTFGNSDLMF